MESLAWRLPPADDDAYQRDLASARAQLGEAAFKAAWEEGRALSLEQATDYALSREEAQQATAGSIAVPPCSQGITAMERELKSNTHQNQPPALRWLMSFSV